jgi:hypothetical protein
MEFSEIGEKFEGLTADQNKMVHTKEYLKKQDEILKELYGRNCAERTKTTPIGQNTHAALYVKGLLQDLQGALFSLHELMYGVVEDKVGDKLSDVTKPIEEIVDQYLLDSISENMSFRDFEEI